MERFIPFNPGQDFASRVRYIANYGIAAIDLLKPEPGEHILDLGCGDGVLSKTIAARGCTVKGVDSNEAMVEAARKNGIDADLIDAASMCFHEKFDAVFSNAALHFMHPIENVVAGVERCLKPGGRFVGEMGTYGNIAAVTTALLAALHRQGVDGHTHIPWVFPSPEEFCETLENAGFIVETLHSFHRPTILPAGIRAWIELFGGWFLDALPPEQRDEACLEVEALLSHTLKSTRGVWTADYRHMRFRARTISNV